MAFQSILFEKVPAVTVRETQRMPECFTDLNLDQVVAALTAGRQEYNLAPLFYTPLHDAETVKYRQAIAQDLEATDLTVGLNAFAQRMREMRRYLTFLENLSFKYHREGWFLEAVSVYCEAATGLLQDLQAAEVKSRGFLALRDFLVAYTTSEAFKQLLAETTDLKSRLSSVHYSILVKGDCVRVRHYDAECDYSQEIEHTFERFRRGAVKDYSARLSTGGGMNYVEAAILEAVAKLNPELFADLITYCERHRDYLNTTLQSFDREIQFYLAYLDTIAGLKQAGLPFCYPHASPEVKEISVCDGFDLALARKLVAQQATVVSNDILLQNGERIIIITGPNQGGKTTFARTFGQLLYLGSLGLPIPGREARLFLPDHIFTHFEREENIQNLRGKLQDDLVRIRTILDRATGNTVIVMNEVFASTMLNDAVFLSKEIMERIIALDLLCVFVTFIDELATLGPTTVSMVSTVASDNPAVRTFKIVRKPADGLAYAMSIVRKHQLTYDCLKERLAA